MGEEAPSDSDFEGGNLQMSRRTAEKKSEQGGGNARTKGANTLLKAAR